MYHDIRKTSIQIPACSVYHQRSHRRIHTCIPDRIHETRSCTIYINSETNILQRLANPHPDDRKTQRLVTCTSPTPQPPHMGPGLGQTVQLSTWTVNQPALTICHVCIYTCLASLINQYSLSCCPLLYLFGVGRYGSVYTCTATIPDKAAEKPPFYIHTFS